MHAGHPFYASQVDATGKKGASLEAKVLLPLKTFAYGVAAHAFSDYFQMSKALTAKCCDEFADMVQVFIVKNIFVSLMLLTSRTLQFYTRNHTVLMECLVHLTVCIMVGRTVQRHGRHRLSPEKKVAVQQWCWRH
jgi:hypothetical protein